MITGKVWGETSILLKTPLIEVHSLLVQPRSHCSKHIHRYKWNAFYVSRGVLMIDVWKSYGLIDRTILTAGQLCTVAPGEPHCFRTAEVAAEAIELYYLHELSEDIVRETVGGVDDVDHQGKQLDRPRAGGSSDSAA